MVSEEEFSLFKNLWNVFIFYRPWITLYFPLICFWNRPQHGSLALLPCPLFGFYLRYFLSLRNPLALLLSPLGCYFNLQVILATSLSLHVVESPDLQSDSTRCLFSSPTSVDNSNPPAILVLRDQIISTYLSCSKTLVIKSGTMPVTFCMFGPPIWASPRCSCCQMWDVRWMGSVSLP